MTKTTTNFTYRRCNLCDSTVIKWHDKEDNNHLCKACYMKKRNVYEDKYVGYVE